MGSTIKSKQDLAYEVQSSDLIPLINTAGTAPKSVTPQQLVNGASSIQVVSTVAVLRSIAPNTSRNIRTSGVTSANDGGGGDWYAVTGAAPGTYAHTVGVSVVMSGGDGSAAWLRDYSGAANIKWFDAPGDGTDITSALTLANAATKTLFWPEGDYLIDDATVAIGVDRLWYGEGVNSRIYSTSTASNMLNIVGSNVTLRDLNIECSSGNASSARVAINVSANVDNARIERCFTGNSRYAHWIACSGLGISNVRVISNTLDTVRSMIWVNNTCNDIEGVWVLFNTADEVFIDGIEFDTPNGAGLTKGFIIGNKVKGAAAGADATGGGIGIGLANVNDVIVDANEVERFTMRGMNIEDTSYDVRVIGNHIKDIGYSIAEIAQDYNDGIVVWAPCDKIKMLGNTIEECQDSGIEVTLGATTSVTNLTIGDNDITNCGKDNGNGVAANASGVLVNGVSATQDRIGKRNIHGNRISDCLQDGMHLGGLQRFLKVNDNELYDNGGYGINRAGNLFNFDSSGNTGHGNTSGLVNSYTQTIYLDPVSGNDSNAGTSTIAAKKTFANVIEHFNSCIGKDITYTIQILAAALTEWTESDVTIDGFYGEGGLIVNGISTNAVYLDNAAGDGFTITNNNLRELTFSRLATRTNEDSKAGFRVTGNQGQIQMFSTNTIEEAAVTNSFGIVVHSSRIYTTNALNVSAPANPTDYGIRVEEGAIAQLHTIPSGVFTNDTQELNGGKVF